MADITGYTCDTDLNSIQDTVDENGNPIVSFDDEDINSVKDEEIDIQCAEDEECTIVINQGDASVDSDEILSLFDKLVDKIEERLKVQYDASRITGADMANVLSNTYASMADIAIRAVQGQKQIDNNDILAKQEQELKKIQINQEAVRYKQVCIEKEIKEKTAEAIIKDAEYSAIIKYDQSRLQRYQANQKKDTIEYEICIAKSESEKAKYEIEKTRYQADVSLRQARGFDYKILTDVVMKVDENIAMLASSGISECVSPLQTQKGVRYFSDQLVKRLVDDGIIKDIADWNLVKTCDKVDDPAMPS